MSTDDKRFGERRSVRLPADGHLAQSPIAELQRLAVSAHSETARVNALRLLLDRMDKQRERDEAREAVQEGGAQEDGPEGLREYVKGITGAAVDNELDPLIAHTAEAALESGDRERYPALLAAFERHVERRARELADADRIDAEVERRAEDLAAQKYSRRDFAVAAPVWPEAAPELTADGEGEDEQGTTTGSRGSRHRASRSLTRPKFTPSSGARNARPRTRCAPTVAVVAPIRAGLTASCEAPERGAPGPPDAARSTPLRNRPHHRAHTGLRGPDPTPLGRLHPPRAVRRPEDGSGGLAQLASPPWPPVDRT